MYGSLWSYASVFGSSFAANFGLGDVGPGAPCNMEADPASCRPLYRVYLAIFAVLAVPLSCLDVKEQALVQVRQPTPRAASPACTTDHSHRPQVIMFGARLLVVLLLTGTVLVAHGCSGVAFSQFGAAHRTADVPLASPAGLGIIIPTCIYAFIYHHSIPILAQPLRDKTSLRAVFSTTIAITGASYLAIGAIVASYFGSDVYAQANLNWRSYVGCMAVDPACEALGNVTAAAAMDGGGSLAARLADSDARSNCYVSSRPPFPAVISYTLLLFPALDVLSAFPLNAVTLGNALMSAVLGEASIIAPADDHPAAEAHGAAGAVVPASDSAGGTPAVAAAAAAIADAVHDDAGSATASVSRRGPGSLNSDDGGADAAAASSGATARPVAGGGIAMGQLRARGASRHAGAGAVGAGDGDGERDSEPLLPAMDTAASGGGARHGHRVAGVGSTRCAWCVSTRRRHRLATTGFRLLASVPAIAGAAFVNNLGTILVFAGMVGVGIAFLIPVLLWVGSISRLRAVTVFAGRALAKVAGVARSSDGDGDTRKQRVGAALPDLPSVARADAGGAAAAEAEAMLAAGASPEVVADAVISRAETSVAPGVVEVWRRTPADPLLRTLYTPAGSLAGTTCGWAYVPEVTFVTAFGVLVYVFAQAIADLR